MKKIPYSSRVNKLAYSWLKFGKKPSQIEKADKGQESVWDYTRPLSIEEVQNHYVAYYNGIKILDTKRAIKICETANPPVYYFYNEDFNLSIIKTDIYLSCEWQGEATCCTFDLGGELIDKVAWIFEAPFEEYTILANKIAFFPHFFQITIDRNKVYPQPGLFSKGWVTSNIRGPFKGVPDSEDW